MTNHGSEARCVLQETKLNPFHSLVGYTFKGRPTIVPLIVCNDAVLFVRPLKDDRWILPQGGIEARDGTLMAAALRESSEELGLQESLLVRSDHHVLGECVNPVPPERGCANGYKHLFYMFMPVRRLNWVVLNHENSAYEWVHSGEQFASKVTPYVHDRTIKLRATCEAIDKVRVAGFLSWSCNFQNI